MRIKFFSALLIALLVSNCDQVHFNQAQPIGKKNITSVPNKLIGKWATSKDSITIGKNHFSRLEFAWIKVPKTEIDSNESLKIIGNKIYDYSEDSLVGMPYVVQNDSFLVYVKGDYTSFDFNTHSEVFLRKLSKNNYIVNNQLENGLYSVYHIKINKDKSIFCSYPHKNKTDLLKTIIPDLSIRKDSNNKPHVWEVGLSAAELKQFIALGGFSDTVFYIHPENKYD